MVVNLRSHEAAPLNSGVVTLEVLFWLFLSAEFVAIIQGSSWSMWVMAVCASATSIAKFILKVRAEKVTE